MQGIMQRLARTSNPDHQTPEISRNPQSPLIERLNAADQVSDEEIRIAIHAAARHCATALADSPVLA